MTDELLKDLSSRIKAAEKTAKILLFGSQARGTAGLDSDIDILVVLDKNETAQTFKAQAENYLKISRAIRSIEKKVSIDLLVYTKPEFERFVQSGSQFSKKILAEGIDLQ